VKITEAKFPKYKITGESVGRQIWYKVKVDDNKEDEYGSHEFNPSVNPNSGDKILRDILVSKWKGPRPDSSNRPKTAKEASKKALEFYQMLQCSDGHWAGDYGGPMFLMPGLICALYITKAHIEDWKKEGMIQYLRNHQQEDGGWGTHIECASTMFGTILSYVSLRLLGVSASEDYMIDALKFIHLHGGALYAPSWAKFWLAVLGVYHWDGINSIPVELWCLPRWFPFHPGRMWCHSRMVYLPMGYLYCRRFVPPEADTDSVLISLRTELYKEDYNTVKWDNFRQTCCEIDAYSPLAPVMKIAQDVLSVYEYLLPSLPKWFRNLRQKGLDFAISYIHAEDFQTNYIDIGPVNKALNLLSVWVDGGMDSSAEPFQRHLMRVDDYLWVAEDGMKMNGYNGSQCWDTSFAAQAIVEGGLAENFPVCAQQVYKFLDRAQIADDEVTLL
jgi:squalene/oxidosqualene cyclase-like protein